MRILVSILFVLVAAGSAWAGERVALVIGNSAYEKLTPLNNPVIDAQRMAAILQANGFDVVSCDDERPGCFDLDRGDMTNILEDFEEMADGADVALVFYAGHGMQTADGNVLAPINMELSCDTLDPKRALLLDNVMDAVAGAKEKIVIVDACRNDPFQAQQCAQRGAKPLSFNSIAVPDSGARFLLMSSTKPGDVAQDGVPGAHSPFARVLFHVMEEQAGVRFDQMLNSVTKAVIEETTAAKFTQVPEMLIRGAVPETCLRGSDCFVDPKAAALKDEVDALKIKNERSQEYEEIVVSLLRSAGYESLDAIAADQRESFFRGIVDASRALGERGDSAGERALAALKAGDESEAERLFEQEAAERDKGLKEEARKAADSYRHLAALVRPKDVAKAAAHFAAAAERDPADIQTWMDLAATATSAGDTEQALRAYREASKLARDTGTDSQRIWAAFGQGDIVLAQGRLDRALDFYVAAKNIAATRVAALPDDANAHRDLSVSHTKVGDILVLQGDLTGAEEAYQANLRIIEELAASNPGNIEWQRDLSIGNERMGDVKRARGNLSGALEQYQMSLNRMTPIRDANPSDLELQRFTSVSLIKIGDVLLAQGNLDGALEAYQADFDIAQRLTAADPSNVGWQRDLSVANERMGDIRRIKGDLGGALELYQLSLDRMVPLRDSDQTNLELQRFTSVTLNKIGDVLVSQGNLDAALEAYQESLDTREILAANDAGNAGWQRDLAVSQNKIGDVLVAQGNLDGALEAHQISLKIAQQLTTSDPGNTEWQHDLSVSHEKVGDVLAAQNDLEGALAAYQADLDIRERLVSMDPGNIGWKRDLSVSNERMGDIRRAQNDLEGALEQYRTSLNRMVPIRDSDPSNLELQRFTSVTLIKIGDVLVQQNNLDDALESYEANREIVERLVASDAGNAEWQRDLSISQEKIGDVLAAQGDSAAALAAYKACLETRQRLADSNPSNAEWQWDLYVTYWRMGKYTDDGVAWFEKAVALLEGLHAEGRLAPNRHVWIERTREELEKMRMASK